MTVYKPSPTIGTCPCPIPKCAELCAVKKFQNRSTRDTGHRFANKWWLMCPSHGRIGMDAKPAMQEYIADHAHMFGAAEAQPPAEPAPVAPPAAPAPPKVEPTPPKPAPAAAPAAAPKPRRPWHDFDL